MTADPKPKPKPNPGVPIKFPNNRPVAQWQVNYDDISQSFRTGDLLLQHGLNLVSQEIELLENNLWSHSGMIVKPSDIGLDVPGDPWCYWESNDILTCNDIITGKPKEGPTLVNLRERLVSNMENTWDYGLLLRHLEVDRTPAMFEGLKNLIPTVHDRGFPDSQECLMTWVAGRLENKKNTGKNIFCSELAALSLQAMGVLGDHYVAAAFSVGDFVEGPLPMLRRARLVDQLLIDPDSVKT